ncbi:MAG: 3-dehydroquinate synthase [Pseudomonadota bacterium]
MSAAADRTSVDSQTTNEVRKVSVALGDRSYEVTIGPGVLGRIGTTMMNIAPGARAGIVADTHVLSIHGETLRAALDAAGIGHTTIEVPQGEQAKCFAEVERVSIALIDAKLERGDVVVALGGGVTGDLAGFCAAITRRGMRFIQVPTSLLAQVDSSVGGKTGIDTIHGKNLIGAFHQPIAVLADTALLNTLDERQMKAGYAEVVKYGLLGDRRFFEWLESNWRKVFAGGPEREEAIARSVGAKAEIVATDEFEAGVRALLNLGHTFGHALESATGYSERLLHGEAISIGMAMAFRHSVELGLCPGQDATRAITHINSVGLPTHVREVEGNLSQDIGGADGMLALMAQDKKVERGALTLILARGIGEAYVDNSVDTDALSAFLVRELAG